MAIALPDGNSALVWPLPSRLLAGQAEPPFSLIWSSEAVHLVSAEVSKRVPGWNVMSTRLIGLGTAFGAPGSLQVMSGACPVGAPGFWVR